MISAASMHDVARFAIGAQCKGDIYKEQLESEDRRITRAMFLGGPVVDV